MSQLTAGPAVPLQSSSTYWKLPLIAFAVWSTALILTYCATCQSASQMFYMLPLCMLALFGVGAASSATIAFKNWRALNSFTSFTVRRSNKRSVLIPLAYMLVWGIAFFITLGTLLGTLLNYKWPLQASQALTTFFAA